MLQMTAIFPLSSPWAGYRSSITALHWLLLLISHPIIFMASVLASANILICIWNKIRGSAVSRSSPLFGGNEQIMKQWLSHSERGPTPRTLYFWNVYLVLRRDSGVPLHRRFCRENFILSSCVVHVLKIKPFFDSRQKGAPELHTVGVLDFNNEWNIHRKKDWTNYVENRGWGTCVAGMVRYSEVWWGTMLLLTSELSP